MSRREIESNLESNSNAESKTERYQRLLFERLVNAIYNNGNLKDIEGIIKLGVDVNLADNNGYTPLYIASQQGRLEVIKVLLAAGGIVNKADNDGNTALFIANQNGHLKIVNYLIAAGGIVTLK